MKKLILFLGLLMFSCSNNQGKEQKYEETKQVNQESVRLMGEAIKLQRDNGFFLSNKKDTLIFKQSVKLMEKAILLDNTYTNAYTNLAEVYLKLEDYEKGIVVLNKLLKLKPNYVEVICKSGFVFERMDELDKARSNYKKAYNIYTARIEISGEYTDYINRVPIVFLLEGRQQAINELESIKSQFPNQNITLYEKSFATISRENLIIDLIN